MTNTKKILMSIGTALAASKLARTIYLRANAGEDTRPLQLRRPALGSLLLKKE